MDGTRGGAASGVRDPGTIVVLVIDDDPAFVRFVEMFLEPEGFRILPALTGTDGLETARERHPDVILLDLTLPDVDGREVLRELKSGEATRGIPVVVVTARGSPGDRLETLDLGGDDYVAKPFDIRELQARLASVVSRARQQALRSEAEKLKTVREVVAGVAHEVNNPLAAILMCAETLEHRYGHNAEVREKSRMIQQNALRIRDILKRLERVRTLVSRPYVAGERILGIEPEGEDR